MPFGTPCSYLIITQALVIKQAVAVAFEVRVRDLVPEFLAHALGIRGALDAAGAVTAGLLQTFLGHLDKFLVFI